MPRDTRTSRVDGQRCGRGCIRTIFANRKGVLRVDVARGGGRRPSLGYPHVDLECGWRHGEERDAAVGEGQLPIYIPGGAAERQVGGEGAVVLAVRPLLTPLSVGNAVLSRRAIAGGRRAVAPLPQAARATLVCTDQNRIATKVRGSLMNGARRQEDCLGVEVLVVGNRVGVVMPVLATFSELNKSCRIARLGIHTIHTSGAYFPSSWLKMLWIAP